MLPSRQLSISVSSHAPNSGRAAARWDLPCKTIVTRSILPVFAIIITVFARKCKKRRASQRFAKPFLPKRARQSLPTMANTFAEVFLVEIYASPPTFRSGENCIHFLLSLAFLRSSFARALCILSI